MNHNEILFKRNKLLIYVICGMLALGVTVNFITPSTLKTKLTLIIVGLVICAIAALFTYKRWFESYIMYFTSLSITVLMMLLIQSGPIITTYLLVYVNLAVMTLYGNYRPILFSSLQGLAITNYLFMDPFYRINVFKSLDDDSLLTLNMFVILAAGALIASGIFSEKLQQDVLQKQNAALQAKNQVDQLLLHFGSSIHVLTSFSSQMKTDVQTTNSISREVLVAFNEISLSMGTQTFSVSDISESIQTVQSSVEPVV